MAFYFCGDGVEDVACSFDADSSQLYAAHARTLTAVIGGSLSSGSRVNIVLGAELMQPYGQQLVLGVDYVPAQFNYAAANGPFSSDFFDVIPDEAGASFFIEIRSFLERRGFC